MTEKHVEILSNSLSIKDWQVRNTVKLLEGDATVPFISRYRKEATGSLDETQVLAIKEQYEKLLEVDKRRETIIKSIEEQGKLTGELKTKLEGTYILS
ncbi:MAG TPA: Tex-like N-terminal domain-containing protein, partial [Bacteroidales bacterium]